MTASAPVIRFQPPRRFGNGAEWMHALGDVPLERIVFDPWPGTATEADLLRFVEHDKRLCELVDGTLVEKPVGWSEAIIASNLIVEMGPHAKRLGGIISGPDSTLRMVGGRVRLPDVAYVSRARLPGGVVPQEAIPSLAPDLAVEVLSESNTPGEMQQKLAEYFESGTKLAWFIDPRTRTVAVYHSATKADYVLGEAGQLLGEQVLAGFEMLVADLFRDLPKDA